ncbi:MAG: ATP-binding cassette domain-containing protein, partial [Mesorhizobium sp.]
MASETILSVKDLRVRFQTLDGTVEAVKGISIKVEHGFVEAVKNVSFQLYRGETIAIVGESGSGKSQTMMAAMSLLSSNGEATGQVDYRGRNLLEMTKSELNKVRGRKISMIFQEPMTSLDPLYT